MKIPIGELSFLVLLFFCGACRTQRIAPTIVSESLPPVVSAVTKGPYQLKAGDRLVVRNLNWSSDLFPDPNEAQAAAGTGFKVLVRSDGSISLPEKGRLLVVGLTRAALADTLAYLYGDVVRDPLFEIEIDNLIVKVLGSVSTQGVVALEKDFISLGEVLARSGGIKYNEASNTIQIIRAEGNQEQIIEYTFNELSNPLIMNQNIYDNDIVYVPPSRGSLRTVRFQRAYVFAQPVLTALNLTLIILNFINTRRP